MTKLKILSFTVLRDTSLLLESCKLQMPFLLKTFLKHFLQYFLQKRKEPHTVRAGMCIPQTEMGNIPLIRHCQETRLLFTVI